MVSPWIASSHSFALYLVREVHTCASIETREMSVAVSQFQSWSFTYYDNNNNNNDDDDDDDDDDRLFNLFAV